MEGRGHARDAGLRPEKGVPGDVAEQGDGRQRKAADRERIPERDAEDRVEVRRGLRAARVEMRVTREHPERGRGESRVEEPMPDGPELAQHAVLKVDVAPAVEEEPEHEQ